MRTKRKVLLLLGVFIVVLTSVRLGWIALQATPDHPPAVRGVMDLRGWKFDSSRPIRLDGEWEWYPSQLIVSDPDQERAAASPANTTEASFIQVPGNWHTSLPGQSNIGYGTYRLRILVDPNRDLTLAIRPMEIATSSAIYVNGRLLGQSGQPASDPSSYTADRKVFTAAFSNDRSEIDLVIQVANFHSTRKGGILDTLLLGSAQAVDRFVDFSKGMQLLLCTVLLIHAAYAILLYFIGTRQRLLLLFAALNLLTLLMSLLSDDRLLLNWASMDYNWSVQLIYLSMNGIYITLAFFASSLLPGYIARREMRWFGALSGAAAICVLFPAPIMSSFGYLTGIAGIWAGLITFRSFLRATLKGEQDSYYLLIGATAVTVNILWSLLKYQQLFEIYFYPIDLIVAFLAFAAYWFKRYFRTASQTSQLAFKLQQADKMKDEFLANTSHELRNPLHGILNIAQSVLENGRSELSGQNAKDMTLLITVARRMSYMLNDLLDLNRLREHGIQLHRSEFRIQAVASGVLDMIRYMDGKKQVRLANEIPSDFPPVAGDENRIIQVLFNLLHNAVKYTHEGSVTIRAVQAGGVARIEVADTGIGMDEETTRRVFQPYEQGAPESIDAGGGIGLGLSISRQLVELHGSRLEVASAPGQGSVFSFALPLSSHAGLNAEPGGPSHWLMHGAAAEIAASGWPENDSAAAAAGTKTSDRHDESHARDRLRILAVDDDPVNRNVLAGLLASEQYELSTASGGEEALALLGTQPWDLVISDVMMPQMSGYELTRRIRERFSLSELPILLLTARSRPEDIQAGFLAGANDYVTKPVEAKELLARVGALTALRASAREQTRMEAAMLQAQIQPHFLFNTLNSIAALSEEDNPADMRELLVAFGDYLRRSFDAANVKQLVPLAHELDLVSSYLFIEKTRFAHRLNIVWEVEPDITANIPPLTIQPLVENAVRHGLHRRSGGGTVRIRIVDREDCIEVAISDDGAGMDEAKRDNLLHLPTESRGGIGLRNTERRLKQRYGSGLQIESSPGAGTTVSFRAPK